MEIKDLSGLGEPLSKLVESVRAALGVVIEPHQIRRIAKARADELQLLESTKLQSAIKTAEAYANLDVDTLALVPGISTDVLARARQRVTRLEIARQNNLDAVVAEAIKALPDQVNGEPVDTTWMKRFFDIAANVDDSKMHGLWGKILAGETSTPGRFSLRTLEVLRNVSKHEAELFVEACHLVMGLNEYVLLIPMPPSGLVMIEDAESMGNAKFSFSDRMILADAGLIFMDEVSRPIRSSTFSIYNNGHWLDFKVEPSPDEANTTSPPGRISPLSAKIPPDSLPIIRFTEAGRAIGGLVADAFNHAYFELLSTRYKKWGIHISLRLS